MNVQCMPKLWQSLYCWCCIVDIGYLNDQNSEYTSVPRAKTVGNQLETAQYRQLEQIKGFSGSRTERQHDKFQ